MASCSETEGCDGDDSARSLMVKLVKLEDQLGLTRWTTLAEVKTEPQEDFEDGCPAVLEDGGMEWVPVKEEHPCMEEAGAFNSSCLNGTPGEGSEEGVSVVSSSDGAATDRCSPGTCVSLATLNNDVTSGLSAQASMDEAMSSIGDSTSTSIITMLTEMHSADNALTTSSQVSVPYTSPQQVNAMASLSPTLSHSSSSTTSITAGIMASSPQVLGLATLSLSSPHQARVNFVSVQDMPGGDGACNDTSLPASEDPMDVVDIASSQLMAIDDHMVKGLEEVVVAASSSPTCTKLESKRADRHAHRKGKRGRKPKKTPAKKASGVEKKTQQKGRGKGRRTSKNCGNASDSVDVSHIEDFHVSSSVNVSENVSDSASTLILDSADVSDIVNVSHSAKASGIASKVSGARKKKRKVSEDNEKGMFAMHPTMGKRVQSGCVSAFNLFRLALLLPSEDAAVEFGQHYNLLPCYRFCPLCGQRLDKLYRIVRQGKRPLFRFQCNKQPCKLGRNQVPLRWGTKFVSSNISVRKAIILDYCFVKKYDIPTAKSESAIPECEESERMVSTSTETVVDYYNHCREICAYFIMNSPPIGGLGYTVELFESFFVGSKSHNEGGSKSHKVHAFQGQYIVAGICIENNDVLFAVTSDLEPNNVLPLLQSKVALGTHMRTSSCETYKQLKKFGYEHTVVKESQLFVHNDLNFSGCTNISQAGTMRPLSFHRRSGTFNLHLAEYLWRRKHRESSDLFVSYLETVASVYPMNIPVEEEQVDND